MVSVLAFASTALAQDSAIEAEDADAEVEVAAEISPSDGDARSLFARARVAYAEARYEAALPLFVASFELSGRTELLYNIGLTLERLRRDDEVFEPFEAYLASNPPAERRAEVERRIEAARARIDARQAEGSSPASSSSSSVAPWVLAGIGGAVAIAGVVLWALGARRVADVEASEPGTREWVDVRGDAESGRTLSIVGTSLLGVGVGIGAVGLGWGLAAGGSDDDPVQAEAVVTWSGTF